MILSVISECLNPCLSVSICGSFLAVSSGLREIIINHPTPIFLCLSYGSVATFFVAADLVFGVKAFEGKFARCHGLGFVLAIEIKRNECRLDQFRRGFKQQRAFISRSSIGQAQII